MTSRTLQIVAISCLLAGVSGCLSHQRSNSVVRLWADHNTLMEPALFFEKVDHKPHRAKTVGYYLWMYGKNPGHENRYAKAREEYEALIAQRLIEETEAVSGATVRGREVPAVTMPNGVVDIPPPKEAEPDPMGLQNAPLPPLPKPAMSKQTDAKPGDMIEPRLRTSSVGFTSQSNQSRSFSPERSTRETTRKPAGAWLFSRP